MNYISNSQEHNRGTNVTKVIVSLGVPKEIKSILQHLQTVFYTGLQLTENDIIMLSDTHRIGVQLHFDTSVIMKIYWFYVMFRVYVRGPVTINPDPVTLRSESQSYIDRLVLYAQHTDIPFDTGIKCLSRIHNVLDSSGSDIINILIQRSVEKVEIIDTPQKVTGSLAGMILTPKVMTPGTLSGIPETQNKITSAVHPKDFLGVSEAGGVLLYQQLLDNEISEARFNELISSMLVIDMYDNMPNSSNVTSEFLAEYNSAIQKLKQ